MFIRLTTHLDFFLPLLFHIPWIEGILTFAIANDFVGLVQMEISLACVIFLGDMSIEVNPGKILGRGKIIDFSANDACHRFENWEYVTMQVVEIVKDLPESILDLPESILESIVDTN